MPKWQTSANTKKKRPASKGRAVEGILLPFLPPLLPFPLFPKTGIETHQKAARLDMGNGNCRGGDNHDDGGGGGGWLGGCCCFFFLSCGPAFPNPPPRRMAGLVFFLIFWSLAGACQRHGVGGFRKYNSSSSSGRLFRGRRVSGARGIWGAWSSPAFLLLVYCSVVRS